MIKNILSLFKEVIENGNQQALLELNDIYEENEIEKLNLNIHSVKYVEVNGGQDIANINLFLNKKYKLYSNPEYYFNNTDNDKFYYIEISDWKELYDRMVLCKIGYISELTDKVLLEFVDLYDKCCELAKKLKIEILIYDTPNKYNIFEFNIQHLNNPEFIKIFTPICVYPPERWFT